MSYALTHHEELERRCLKRHDEIADAAEFGRTFTNDAGETLSYAAWAPAALEQQKQLELELPGFSQRAAIRQALADKIERELLPVYAPAWLHNYPRRLRQARLTGTYGVEVETGKILMRWDSKAGLARLCPDDAREEAMRLRRRVLPTLEALQASGHQLTYAVFTTPNAAPGDLRKECARIFRRFRQVMRAKDADGQPVFPQIKGALCVLEAPLGRSRDWNVHLNVILATRGFFDWKRLRAQWHWNVELRLLPKAPGAIGAALTELIKYAVAATVAKSADKATAGEEGGGTYPPPMLEWTPAELKEWMAAMHGFRRTRAYGALYGLKKPEPEPLGRVVWVGTVGYDGARYRTWSPLLGSIPEDNFSGSTGAERWLGLIRSLALGQIAGAGELGASIPSHFELPI